MEWRPLVRAYESRFWRRSPASTALLGISFPREFDVIEKAVKLRADSTVLDLACGPGIYTRAFATIASRGAVIGLDLSGPMLDYATKRARQENLDNARFVRASALDLPFADQVFDHVNCCGALHLFPDPDRALREVARVLRPQGSFTTAVFRAHSGAVMRHTWDAFAQRIGMRTFAASDLAGDLTNAGLDTPQCHHDRRLWMIMSAQAPA